MVCPMRIETYRVNDDHAMAMLGPIAFIVWRSPTISVADMRATEGHARAALRGSPEGVGLLAFAGSAAPSREVRRVSTLINERLHETGAVGVAAVLDDGGVLGAVQRGMATGMLVLSSRSYPLRVFGDTEGACGWLANRLRSRGITIHADAAAAQLDAFRDRYLGAGSSAVAG